MIIADKWIDYELLDTGSGEKLEKWGKYILRRPDPQAMWPRTNQNWNKVDAHYHRSKNGGGNWEFKNNLSQTWEIRYKDLKFNIKPMGFKHTGIFPEQAANWDWMQDKIKASDKQLEVLNLFAYTGGATVACAGAGAKVCHVDAAKGMVLMAKDNLKISGLSDKPVRFIVDDVVKFVEREIRRGNKYDGIIMDPPVYGHGPNGEVWSIEKDLYDLIEKCIKVLSEKPTFIVINCYTGGISPLSLQNLMHMSIGKVFKGNITCEEIGLPIKSSGLVLPCGITGRWESN